MHLPGFREIQIWNIQSIVAYLCLVDLHQKYSRAITIITLTYIATGWTGWFWETFWTQPAISWVPHIMGWVGRGRKGGDRIGPQATLLMPPRASHGLLWSFMTWQGRQQASRTAYLYQFCYCVWTVHECGYIIFR